MTRTSRKNRRWLSIMLGVATVATVTGSLVLPSAANAAIPTSWVGEQVNFILSKQLPTGAIVGANSKISPYFANEAALGLLKANTPASLAGALNWMKWYLAHLNAAATNVPANSVFDYTYDPTTHTETSTGDFDSVDSYASTTLSVAYWAYTSGDPEFVKVNEASVSLGG